MTTENIETTAELYNKYMEEYNKLLKDLKNCEFQLMNDFFKFKTTERDEIKIALFNTKRKPLVCVKHEDDALKLDLQSTLYDTKKDMEQIKDIDQGEIKVIDPIKLIHGGFTSVSIKKTAREYRNLIIQIIHIVNLKKQIEQNLKLD